MLMQLLWYIEDVRRMIGVLIPIHVVDAPRPGSEQALPSKLYFFPYIEAYFIQITVFFITLSPYT